VKMIRWADHRQYSMAHDAEMSRVSGWDENHQEHWLWIDCGKDYRRRREDAVLTIMDAIEADKPPGEVDADV